MVGNINNIPSFYKKADHVSTNMKVSCNEFVMFDASEKRKLRGGLLSNATAKSSKCNAITLKKLVLSNFILLIYTFIARDVLHCTNISFRCIVSDPCHAPTTSRDFNSNTCTCLLLNNVLNKNGCVIVTLIKNFVLHGIM